MKIRMFNLIFFIKLLLNIRMFLLFSFYIGHLAQLQVDAHPCNLCSVARHFGG